jgi:hypothetical protein
MKAPEQHAAELQADLEAVNGQIEALLMELEPLRELARRYKGAIKVLAPEAVAKPKPKPKAPRVSDKVLAAVEAALPEQGELVSVIAKRAGYSVNPTKAALELLHQLGDARLTGKGRGGGKLYAAPVRLEAVA